MVCQYGLMQIENPRRILSLVLTNKDRKKNSKCNSLFYYLSFFRKFVCGFNNLFVLIFVFDCRFLSEFQIEFS